MNASGGKHRSKTGEGRVVGLSISSERDELLRRGLGFDHLRELLLRIARPLVRAGASLAYAGHWRETPDNFTYELLRLISAEQEDNSLDTSYVTKTIGRLYNHLAWPLYRDVTPTIEAQWIHCCRILRITQELAGIESTAIVADGDDSPAATLNAAIVLSAARRHAAAGMDVVVPDGSAERIEPVHARIALGGKLAGYSGFVPGIFEEASLALSHMRPLYLLGGFGGATGALADALLSERFDEQQGEFHEAWHAKTSPTTAQLGTSANGRQLPDGVLATRASLAALREQIKQARTNLPQMLRTGLGETETRELMRTTSMRRAVELVLKGLGANGFLRVAAP